MWEEKQKTVIVAYTGELLTMKLSMFDPSIFPLVRIEGVFSSEEEFEKWMEAFQFANEHTLVHQIELPLNPTLGQIESETEAFVVKTNKNLEVLSMETVEPENDSRFSNDYVQSKETEEGYEVACWARDEFDACKRAVTELREFTTEINLEMEEENENDIVAKVIIHMPTSPEVSFELPIMFSMPEVGEILDIRYENFISDPDEWELAKSTLDNDVMVVDRVEGDDVYLREGNSE
tara:strand:- start:1332 stop:2036 length:705 start_codon:yes stop_codon:yes gene_type:complete